MKQYLPSFYYNCEEVRNILASIELESNKLHVAIKDLLDQLFIETATWGIEHWERYLGLEVDNTENIENRRSRVKTKLRGNGTFTKESLKNICRSFVNGEVEIIEDTANYRFVIKFIDIKGIPGNIDYLTKAIEDVKPAHLAFSFEYAYNTWNTVKALNWSVNLNETWDSIKVR